MNLKFKTLAVTMANVFSAFKNRNVNFDKAIRYTVLGFLFAFVGINLCYGQIVTRNALSNVYHGTANYSNSYTIPTGTDSHRVLIVGIASVTQSASARTVTINYGGQTLIPINGNINANTIQHSQFYYLNEVGIDAATASSNSTLSYNVTGGITAMNDVFVGVYDYVDQTTPITDSKLYSSQATELTTFQFATGLTINANDLPLKILSSVATGITIGHTISNFGTSWTVSNPTQTSSYNTKPDKNNLGCVQAVGIRSVSTTNNTDVSSTTMSGVSLISMTGISLNEVNIITTGTIAGSSFCAGASVSVPFTIYGTYNSGNIFTAQILNASGSFASPVNIGTLTSTTAGTISAIIPVGTATGINYRIRVVSSNPAITGIDNGVSLTINALPAIATTTGGLICIGSTANLSASGAVAGDKYVWYSAASGGTPLKTSTNNTDNIFTTPTLVATTNYWVAILNTNGCEGVRTQVTATFPTVSNDNETAAGTNTWIGHVYDGIAFNTYYGRYFETETFNQSFGGTTNCFGITSNAVARSIYTETFSVRYRMNSTKKGLYRVDMGSDDGNRLTVDGTLVYSDWSDHPVHDSLNVLLSLNGASSLIYDFYENGGGNTVYFQNLNLLLANNLTTNLTQSISAGSLGTAISGDVYGTLPTGISLSGTGYQWTYSTTPGGARINIAGATGATYTPNTSLAPFNVAGTYYIFRNALLSRKNNVSPNPYIATSESNVVTLTVYVPTIVVSPSSLNGFSYIFGFGPSSQQSFTVSGSNLVDNIIVTPTTNYEISTTSGTGFQSTAITLTQSGGTVASTPIYVRLKAGLPLGEYLNSIGGTSTGALTKNVTCTGSVTLPTITVSKTSLTGFSYDFSSGPSAEQTFTVSGSGLSTNISVAPSTNFEISTTSGTGFGSTLTLTQIGGNVPVTTIYVRLKAGIVVGTVASENIVSTSTDATTKNVAVSGSVYSTYCTVAPGTNTLRYISNVTLNTINNTTVTSSYTNYTSLSTNIPQGTTYILSVTMTFTGNAPVYLYAWIDWNKDGDFLDVNEVYNMGTGNGTTTTPVTLTTNISVPATAVPGKTRMRITANYQAITGPCDTGLIGEVEDYSINTILSTITTGTITGSPFSVGNAVSVPFTVSDGFVSGNIFTAQLSNSSGSFASPVNIGTLNSTTSGTINATIPSNSQNGNGYRIRVISSSPVVTGTDNGSNLTVNGGTPFVIATPISLTSFTYPVGFGPSAEQSFTVSGINLLGNILLTPSVNFEISTGSGASFVASSLITLQVSGGVVSSTTIRVRMKAGHALGAVVAENISCESTGAITASVSCNGTVITAPEITTSVITESFSYTFGSGPSASKTFTVNGTYLGGSVVITPPANYEISSNGGTNYQSTAITLALSSGNAATYTGVLNTTTITVRLKTALGTGSYSENVVATSTSAVSKNVALSGTVTASATIYNAISSLSGFIYTLGNGPSGFQSFVVKASALTDNVIVTPPAANFEISKDSVNFQSMQLTLLRNGTTLTADTIVYVRMKSGISVIGTYGPVNSSIVLTSAGAITKSVACKGEVVDTKKILVSKNTLTGFGYKYSASPVGGPSSPQSFTVSGALLTENVVITAPTNYEISKKSSSGYSSTISLTGTTVNPTIIYVRLKSGLPAADYGTLAVPLNLTVASSGATTINVFCIGKVFASPLIAAGGGGSFCEGSTINLTSTGSDIQSFYWTGPNNYYLSTQNPVLSTNATASLSGTYTVNGSVVVGGNLITNGDFEAGNTSFSSGYGYVAPSATALNPEGMYTIVNLPSAVHGDFTNHPDHTTGTGLQMVVNGSPIAGVVVWSQSVPVIPGASYQFTYSEQTVNITQVPKNASQLQLYVNGVAAGPVYTAPLVNYQWATFMYNATAGTNAVLNLELINQNTIVSGNDFSLDDIVFQQILPATAPQIVIVSPSVVAAVNVTYSPTNVYQNVPVVFTANPINGGVTPAYKWFVGGVEAVGQTSSTFSYTPSSTALLKVRCEMTTSILCATPKPAIDTEVITVQAPLVNYWMGYTDIDWGKPENWTAGYIPATGDNVIYATAANFGTSAMKDLQLDQNRTIGSLINATTKRLVIPAAKGLTVNNTIDISNKVNEADRIYIYSSSTLPNGSLSFKNLSSNPVAATVEMYSKAWWNLADTINNRFRWQYFGIPLRSVVAFPTFNGSYVRRWDETKDSITNHWIQLNNSSVLQPFYGYEICQEIPKKVYFKGILENGNFNSGPLAITSSALFPGQHIFANPYTAAIDIRQLTFGEGMQKIVYLYNTGTFAIWKDTAKIKLTNEGQYVAVPFNLAGENVLPRQVPSMQAMLVKATTVVDANFSINYNSVIMNNTDQQRINEPNEVSEEVSTKIDLIGENFNDKMWLFSKPGCSRNYDNGWDGFKMYGNAFNPQIFAIEPDGNYQVSTVEDMNNTNLGFLAGSDVQYTLKFTHTNIRKYYQGIYLVDLIENNTVDITETGSEYKFYAESTPKPINRFKIVTRPYEQKASDFNSQVKIFSAGKTLFIHNFSNVEGEFVVYDISGRILKKGKFGANGITGVITNYISGGYVVRAKTSLEEVSKRIILR